jgi:uncharacterized protein (TIGR02145 family)
MRKILIIGLISILCTFSAFSQSKKAYELLQEGIKLNDKELINKALSKKITLNDGLNESIAQSNFDYTKYFLEKGADPSSGIEKAVKINNIILVKYLIEKGAKFNDYTGHDLVGKVYYDGIAIKSKWINGRHYWIYEGNSRKVITHPDGKYTYNTETIHTGNRSLISAIDNNNLEMVELILNSGIDVKKPCTIEPFRAFMSPNELPTPPSIMLPIEYAVFKNVKTSVLDLLLKYDQDSKTKYAYNIEKVSCIYENSSDSILTLNTDKYGISVTLNRECNEIFGVKLFYSTDNINFKEIKFLAFPSDTTNKEIGFTRTVTRYYFNEFGDSIHPNEIILKVDINAYGKFLDTRNGEQYKTVKIGNQIVMAENLRYKIEDGCWVISNDPNTQKKYGYSYTFKGANSVAPLGWHLPSIDEWKRLFEYAGGYAEFYGAMKELQFGGSTGFNLTQAGTHSILGFTEVGIGDFFWSSTPTCLFMLFSEYNGFQIPWLNQENCVRDDTKVGCSVRLFKDK